MILSGTAQVIRAKLAGAISTLEPDWYAAWVDLSDPNSKFVPSNSGGLFNGTSYVTVVGAPASSEQRQVKMIVVFNTDDAPITATFEYYNGTSAQKIASITLNPGERADWEPGGTWHVYTQAGILKMDVPVGTGGGGGGVAISAGSQVGSTGTIRFANSNGITFGMSNSSVITASVVTDYAGLNGAITGGSMTLNTSGLSIALPAYLTTAALSQDSSKYAGINGAMTGGSMTLNTSGLSIALPAYLTTAALSQDSSKYAGINGAITGGSMTLNTSGLSIALPAYLTTAAQSGHTHGTPTINGALSITSQSNAWTISIGAYLTTAALSQDSSKYAGINGAITGGSLTLNTSGLSINLPAYLTTAAQSNHSHGNPTLALTNLTGTTASNSAGFTLSLSAAAPGGGGGPAISAAGGSASNGTIVFSNSNNVSFGWNASTITASASFTPQSVQTLGFYAVGNTTQSTSGTMDARTISFNGMGIASVGVSNGSILISVPSGGGGLTNINVSGGTTSQNLSNIVFGNGGNVSFGLNGSTITASAPSGGGGATLSLYDHIYPLGATAAAQLMLSNSFYVMPVHFHNAYSFDFFRFYASLSAISTTVTRSAAATGYSGGISHTYWWKLYSMNTGASSYSAVSCIGSSQMGMSQQISLSQNTTQTNGTATYSVSYRATFPLGTGTTTYSTSTTGAGSTLSIISNLASLMTGWVMWDMPALVSIPSGCYFLVMGQNSTTATQGVNQITGGGVRQSFIVATQPNVSYKIPGLAGGYAFQAGLGQLTSAGTTQPASQFDIISQVATVASHVMLPFAGLRFA